MQIKDYSKIMREYIRKNGSLDGFSHPDITFVNMDTLKEINKCEVWDNIRKKVVFNHYYDECVKYVKRNNDYQCGYSRLTIKCEN